jgi:DNA-binding protein YbaB
MSNEAMDLDTLGQTAMAAISGVVVAGCSTDGRVTARMSGDFELVELVGLELADPDREAIRAAVNAAIAALQEQMFERLSEAFG